MKLTQKQLRKIILKEINTLKEEVNPVDALSNMYKEFKPFFVQFGMTMSPIGFGVTYLNNKKEIDAAYETGGAEAATEVFRTHHSQLTKDVGQPMLDAIQGLSDSL